MYMTIANKNRDRMEEKGGTKSVEQTHCEVAHIDLLGRAHMQYTTNFAKLLHRTIVVSVGFSVCEFHE